MRPILVAKVSEAKLDQSVLTTIEASVTSKKLTNVYEVAQKWFH